MRHSLVVNGETLGISAMGFEDSKEPAVRRFDFGTNGEAGASPAHYVVTLNDQSRGLSCLRSVAQAVYGDSSLWYVIAEANGLENDGQVIEGRVLEIPSNVSSARNDATVFRPYRAEDIRGDNTPALPKPQADEGCGTMGQLVVAIVVIVVAAITEQWYLLEYAEAETSTGLIMTGADAVAEVEAGTAAYTAETSITSAVLSSAAGNVAGQLVANAIGAQHGFSWKSAAASAASMGIMDELGVAGVLPTGPSSLPTAVRAAINNAVTQGVNVALGVQKEFSWAAVAASAVAAPLAKSLGDRIGNAINGLGGADVANIARGWVSGVVTQTAVRAANGGSIKWENIAADAFGNVLGNSLVNSRTPAASQLTPWDYDDAEVGQANTGSPGGAPFAPIGQLGSGGFQLLRQSGAGFVVPRMDAFAASRIIASDEGQVGPIQDGFKADPYGVPQRPVSADERAIIATSVAKAGQFKVDRIFDRSNPHQYAIVALADGTSNSRSDLPFTSNVLAFESLLQASAPDIQRRVLSVYKSGPATEEPEILSTFDAGTGTTALDRARALQLAIADRVGAVLDSDSQADVVLGTISFSRGGVVAAALRDLVMREGLPDTRPGSAYEDFDESAGGVVTRYARNLIEPGKANFGFMGIFDTVRTGISALSYEGIPFDQRNVFSISAINEYRRSFPGTSVMPEVNAAIDGRIEIPLPGAHSDIGGTYDRHGIGSLSLSLMRDFIAETGIPIAPIPPERVPDPSQFFVHDSRWGISRLLDMISPNTVRTLQYQTR